MPTRSKDDVIRIRIDTSRAVRAFLDLLERQAAEGETRQPAKPRATAVYRELAPYRLVEYTYVDEGVGEVQGAYVGLPCGTVYSVSDEIPEAEIDALVDGPVEALPPIYVFVVLEDWAKGSAIDHFLGALPNHVGMPLVGVFRDKGVMVARGYNAEDAAEMEAAVARAATETDLHLGKELVLDRYVARSESPDGRAFAKLGYDFAKHLIEFPSATDRDDFVAWSRKLCDWVTEKGSSWEELGFTGLFRAAEPVPAPAADKVVTALVPPARFEDGRPWQSFGVEAASVYWHYVKDNIDGNEAGARRLDGWVVKS